MTALLAASLSLLMIFTALLSGVFGMAGGLILIGVLLVVMPLPQAMVLHAVTQMASNGWRAILWWRHIEWKIAAASIVGSVVAVGLWSLWLYVPDKAVALLLLGLSPFIVRAIPASVLPQDARSRPDAGRQRDLHDADADRGRHRPAARHAVPALDARAAADHRHQGRLPALQPQPEAGLFRPADRPVGSVEPWLLAIAVASSMIGTSLGKLLLEKLTDTAVPQLVEPHHHRDRDLLCRLRPGADGGDRLDRSFLPSVAWAGI